MIVLKMKLGKVPPVSISAGARKGRKLYVVALQPRGELCNSDDNQEG